MKNPILVSLLALSLAASGVAASAQPGSRGEGNPRGESPRDDWRRAPPPGWNRDSWEYRQRYERRHPRRRHDDNDSAVIAGIFGFVLGAAIASSQDGEDQIRPKLGDPNWIDYCRDKYASFDPESGTYLGYDGFRHYCQ